MCVCLCLCGCGCGCQYGVLPACAHGKTRVEGEVGQLEVSSSTLHLPLHLPLLEKMCRPLGVKTVADQDAPSEVPWYT